MTIIQCVAEAGWQGLIDALRTANPGDEVRLQPGFYRADMAIELPAGVHLSGTHEAVLTGQGPIISIRGTGSRVSELSFVASETAYGALIDVANTRDIIIERCKFEGRKLSWAAVIVTQSHDVSTLNSNCSNCKSGILYFSSSGLIRKNECCGNTGPGIAISQHSTPTEFDGRSDVCVVGNSCHDNQGYGIGFWSSRGLAIDNDCRRNGGSGMCIQRDGKYPDQRSDVDVIANCCSDNVMAGIWIGSSCGLVQGNECSRNRQSGITVRRDEVSRSEASDVCVISNSCFGNTYSGIYFASSKGKVQDNRCWGNFSGIMTQPDELVTDDRWCAEVIGNRCSENKYGIVCMAQVSDCAVRDNDCFDNKYCGIAIVPSITRITQLNGVDDFDDWMERVAQSPREAIESMGLDTVDGASGAVEVIGNRCYFNQLGLYTFHPNSMVRENECWGNTNSGLHIGVSTFHGVKSSRVKVVSNRCHDNKDNGISSDSSQVGVQDNECWGNSVGIRIEGSSVSRYAVVPLMVEVVDNYCHNNKKAGVAYISSQGRVQGNVCWENGTGISIERGTKRMDASADVAVVRNCCYENITAGINFLASQGQAQDNECWGNRINDIRRDTLSDVEVISHRMQPSLPLAQMYARRLANPLGNWLTAVGSDSPIAEVEALADFLTSGGCPDCFKRFWSHSPTRESTEKSLPDTLSAYLTKPKDHRVRALGKPHVYRAQTGKDGRPDINGIQANDSIWNRRRPASGGFASLSALLSKFGSEYRRFVTNTNTKSSNVWPPVWTVAAVSADEASFDAWLADKPARIEDIASGMGEGRASPTVEMRRFDFTGFGQDRPAGGPRFLERALLGECTGFWPSFREVLKMLPLIQVQAWLFFLLWGGALALANLVALAVHFNYAFKQELSLGLAMAPRLAVFVADRLLQPWDAPLATTANVATGALVSLALVIVFFLNRNLPGELRIPIERLLGVIDALNTVPVIKSIRSRIEHVGCSESSWRHWLRGHVYGYRRCSLWKRRPNLVLVALCNVDVPSADDIRQLRTLLDVCPSDQGILLITQMPGLSMLPSGYLDVWFREAKEEDALPNFEAYIVHDAASAQIVPPENETGIQSFSHAIEQLVPILGWHEGTLPMAEVKRALEGATDRTELRTALQGLAHTLTDRRWTVSDLLPTLIIGSTPMTHMLIGRENKEEFLYETALRATLDPYYKVFPDNDPAGLRMDDARVKVAQRRAQESDGLIVADRMGAEFLWIGRVGYRVKLAAALRELFATSPRPGDSEGAEHYLARLMACGELYNLNRLVVLLTDAANEESQRLLPLHMEAALFLLRERLALAPKLAVIDVVATTWEMLLQAIRRESTCAAWYATRLCAALLTAADHGVVMDAEESALTAVIDNPFSTGAEDAPLTVWGKFLADVASMLRRLVAMERSTALLVLESKLQQEWFLLPERYKLALRNQVDKLPGQFLGQMGRAQGPEPLLKLAVTMRQRPALVVAGLGILATADARRWARGFVGPLQPERSPLNDVLCRLADAVLTLRKAAGDSGDAIDNLFMLHGGSISTNGAASAVLLDDDSVDGLCKTFEAGANDRRAIAQAAQGAMCEIEGVALGVHGKLHGVLSMVSEVGEIYL